MSLIVSGKVFGRQVYEMLCRSGDETQNSLALAAHVERQGTGGLRRGHLPIGHGPFGSGRMCWRSGRRGRRSCDLLTHPANL